jgi:predicted nuclease of predicted toxin-antitoxin system
VRVLLDENLDRRLRRFFDGNHEVLTVAGMGWAGKKNGELLDLAQQEFDAFLTTDQGIPHQQNVRHLDLAVMILEARSNTLEDLTPLMEKVNTELRQARPGATVRLRR